MEDKKNVSRHIIVEYDYKDHHIVIMDLGHHKASYVLITSCDVVNTRWFTPWVDYCFNFLVVDDHKTKRNGIYIGHSYFRQSELDVEEIRFDTELAVERLIQIGL